VGWLATHLKEALGTGVIVVRGHNAARGEVRRLRAARRPSLA
jgi:hypothetical protein